MRITTAITTLALLIFVPAASAATEFDDAGDLPATAQDLSGETVEQIVGNFLDGEDVDMYRLCLEGGGTFSASTIGGTPVDTQLYLFDSNGRGVYGNDDSAGKQSLLPAGHVLTPSARGEYLLAVGPMLNLTPGNAAGAIFSTAGPVFAPTGPGASNPVDMWSGRSGRDGDYRILLTGAGCRPPDTSAPAIDLRSPLDGAEVSRDERVEVDFECADEPGGSGLASCVGSVADGGLLDTSAPGPVSVTVEARDMAGNASSVTHTVNVVARDTTAPAIEVRSPLDGSVFLLGELVTADFSCADEAGGSGLASCAGSVADGAAIDTRMAGAKTFKVTAADAAGNTSTASSSYRVVYDFEGFLWPVANRPEVNRWKAGRPVPMRFELGGNQGLDVIADGWPKVAQVQCGSGAEPETGAPARAHAFREFFYRKRRNRYVYWWQTEREWAGSCVQFMLKLDDGTVKRADFEFPRRGRGHWD